MNSRVGWAESRNKLHLAAFSARVIADKAEQNYIDDAPLRRIPTLMPGERQLPTGPGERSAEPASHRWNGAGSSELTGRAGEARPAAPAGGLTHEPAPTPEFWHIDPDDVAVVIDGVTFIETKEEAARLVAEGPRHLPLPGARPGYRLMPRSRFDLVARRSRSRWRIFSARSA